MRTYLISISFFLSMLMHSMQAQGMLGKLPADEQAAIEAIALYPADERVAVLTAARHPEILVRMEHIRKNTEAEFTALLADLPQEDQAKIYNLSRYPELLSAICDNKKNRSKSEMNDLLKDYPDDIHEDAQFGNKHYFDLLRKINTLDLETEAEFEAVIAPYPEDVRAASRQLAQLPAVLSVLTANMSMTVLLGDIYRTNPVQLDRELDSLRTVLAEQQATELSEWKQSLEANPEAMREYEEAAKEFAATQQYGDDVYDDDVYDYPVPDYNTPEVYVDYYWRPYSYWFGWPSWYGYECWYPYPYWYHWGFYYGPGNAVVFIGMPSNYFFQWHFYYDPHLYYYPHFTDQVMDHYYGPRTSGTRVQPVLRQWEADRRKELPADWFKDDANRTERIRDYGKFKTEYNELVKVARDKAPTEREYLKENVDRYPTLKPVLKQKPDPTRSVPATPYEPTRQTDPAYQPREKTIQQQQPPRQEEIDRARQTHQNTWNPQPPRQQSSPGAAPSRPPSQPRSAPAQPPQNPPRQTSPRQKN